MECVCAHSSMQGLHWISAAALLCIKEYTSVLQRLPLQWFSEAFPALHGGRTISVYDANGKRNIIAGKLPSSQRAAPARLCGEPHPARNLISEYSHHLSVSHPKSFAPGNFLSWTRSVSNQVKSCERKRLVKTGEEHIIQGTKVRI